MQLSRYLDVVTVGFSTAANSVAEIDASNCEGVLFIGVPCSSAARTWSMALKSGATTTGFVNCHANNTLTSTAAAVNVLITDVHKPAKRYIGATFASTTATPCFLIAAKYNVRVPPVNFSATANVPVAAGGIKRVVSPTST